MMRVSQSQISLNHKVVNIILCLIFCMCYMVKGAIDNQGKAVLVFQPIVNIVPIVLLVAVVIFLSTYVSFDRNKYNCFIYLLLSLLTLFGQSLADVSDLSVLYSSFGHLFRSFLSIVSGFWFYNCFFSIVYYLLAKIANSYNARTFADIYDTQWKLWQLILAILILWIPYIFKFFPGSLPTDTARQLGQWSGAAPLDNHFPYLTTLIYGVLFNVGSLIDSDGVFSIFIPTLFQIIFGAISFAYCLKRLAPFTKFPITFFGVLFLGLVPIVPVYVMSLSKDYLHAVGVCLLLTESLICIYKNDSRWSQMLKVFFLGLFVALTRNNGLIYSLLIILCVGFAIKARKCVAPFMGILFVFVIWNKCLLPSLGIAPSETKEILSMPAQAVARVYKSTDEIPDNVNTIILGCSTIDDANLSKVYKEKLSDPAKDIISFDGRYSLLDYLRAVSILGFKYPNACISGALSTTVAYWYPFCDGTYWSEDAPYYPWPEWYEWSLIDDSWYKGLSWMQNWNETHRSDFETLHEQHVSSNLLKALYHPGFYCWLLLLLITISNRSNRLVKAVLTCSIPFFGLLLTLIAGPCASLRYSLPLIFSAPIFAMLLFDSLGVRVQKSKEV